MKTKQKFQFVTSLLAVALLMFSSYAYASTVVYENVQLVNAERNKNTTHLNDYFYIEEKGDYTATLTDFEFPAKFKKLGLIVTSSSKKMGELWNEGSFNFTADIGRHYIGLLYKTRPKFNLAMYGIKISRFSPTAVPLPLPLWLMVTGLLSLFIYKRKSVISSH